MPAVQVYNLEKIIAAFGKATVEVPIKMKDGIKQCLEVIGRKSDKYVPKDTLELVQSKVLELTGQGATTRGSIKYTADHAVPVHEDLQAYHTYPTCAKYLERAIRETRGTCTSIMRRTVKVVGE